MSRRYVMENANTLNLSMRHSRAEYEQICPECGSKMAQVERISENGVTFIWYKCNQESCTGQWLQKLQQTSFTLSNVRQVVGAY
jgi:ribosomal protein L37AE/L43A